MDWDFVTPTHAHEGIPTRNMTHKKKINIILFSVGKRASIFFLFHRQKATVKWIWRVTKFTLFKEYWQSSRERDEYVWTGPSPARAAFAQTMGCRCGSGPGPDEENEIARAG